MRKVKSVVQQDNNRNQPTPAILTAWAAVRPRNRVAGSLRSGGGSTLTVGTRRVRGARRGRGPGFPPGQFRMFFGGGGFGRDTYRGCRSTCASAQVRRFNGGSRQHTRAGDRASRKAHGPGTEQNALTRRGTPTNQHATHPLFCEKSSRPEPGREALAMATATPAPRKNGTSRGKEARADMVGCMGEVVMG